MAKRDSWPLVLNCTNEYDRDLLYEAIMTMKDIYSEGDNSNRIPAFSTASQTMLWAKTTIERCIASGVWIDQEEEFNVRVPLEERI